jgi:hypothetical protein
MSDSSHQLDSYVRVWRQKVGLPRSLKDRCPTDRHHVDCITCHDRIHVPGQASNLVGLGQ